MELIHTCYRITDPERSIAFYEALGLEKRRELPIRDEAMGDTLAALAEKGIEPERPAVLDPRGAARCSASCGTRTVCCEHRSAG